MMTSGSNRHALRGSAAGARVPSGRIAQPRVVGRWLRSDAVGMTPARLAAVISAAERGDLEDWADTAEAMLREDPHIRSVYETFIRSVVSAELRIEPVDDTPEAALAADFCQEAWDAIERPDVILEHLLHGEGVWCGLVEHDWKPTKTSRGTAWLSCRQWTIPARDVELDDDWTPKVRSWDGGAETWIRLDEEPNAWMAHIPGGVGINPHLAGVLMACAWSWLFKKWAITFRQQALERFASPIAVGKSSSGAASEARAAFLEALENISANGAIVLEQDQTVDLIRAAESGGKAWQEAIGHLEDEITKAILGSTLNVDVGSTGGNRALGESQAETTILPRLMAAASRLAFTLREQWAKPTLAINARLFGQTLPAPALSFDLEGEPDPVITALHVNAGVVEVDELRRSAGLPAWGVERGGSNVVEPQPQAPAFSSDEGSGSAAAPFARSPRRGQLTLPMTSRRPTSPTRSDSPTRTGRVPWLE